MARPAKYTDPAEIEQKLKEYLNYCEAGKTVQLKNKRGEVDTVTLAIAPSKVGFNLFCGFSSEEHLDRVYGTKKRFHSVISRAWAEIKDRVVIMCELGLIESQIGRLRMIKLGYTDKSRIDMDIRTSHRDIDNALQQALNQAKKQSKVKTK